jgi:hypothetical protein
MRNQTYVKVSQYPDNTMRKRSVKSQYEIKRVNEAQWELLGEGSLNAFRSIICQCKDYLRFFVSGCDFTKRNSSNFWCTLAHTSLINTVNNTNSIMHPSYLV